MFIFSFVSSFLTQSGNPTSCSSFSLPLLWRRLQDSIFGGREGAEVQDCSYFRSLQQLVSNVSKVGTAWRPSHHPFQAFSSRILKNKTRDQLRWVSVGGQGKGGWFWSFLPLPPKDVPSLFFLKTAVQYSTVWIRHVSSIDPFYMDIWVASTL